MPIKNISPAKVAVLESLVEYQEGRVVSLTLAQEKGFSVTVFAFTKGEGLSAHTASGDALVHILDGKAEITIGEEVVTVEKGEFVVMPANVPHALEAVENFKMFLLVVE